MNKSELRAVYRQIRLRMSKSEINSKSRIIGRKLLNDIDWNSYQKICVYAPIERLNEVDINGVILRLQAQRREVTVLSADRKSSAPKLTFDLILVPCLAFDSDNYRLGWGGGFYDKFLAAQPKALKIGVCFSNGSAENLPREPHDIRLDKIISDS